MNSEEIEQEFMNSQTRVSDLKNEDTSEEGSEEQIEKEDEKSLYLEFIEDGYFWRIVVLAFMMFSGGLIFHHFFPIKFLTSELLWEKYANNCCYFIYNMTRCSFNNNCSDFLLEWIRVSDKNRNITQECCYWFAPYSKWRILSEAFCEMKCLN